MHITSTVTHTQYHAAVKRLCDDLGIDLNKADTIMLGTREFTAGGGNAAGENYSLHGSVVLSSVEDVPEAPRRSDPIPMPTSKDADTIPVREHRPRVNPRAKGNPVRPDNEVR